MQPFSLSILIADAWPDSAESLGLLLKLVGHQVHIALDGHAAMQVFRQQAPDVAILDVHLPKLNGIEFARQVCERDGGKPLLLALTGHERPSDRALAHLAGFDHFFLKPFDPGQLLLLIDEHAKCLSRPPDP